MASSYPSWTPYAFAMNRVIDGVDLDGKEFSKSTFLDENGTTYLKITVKVNPINNSFKISKDRFQDILDNAINEYRNNTNVYDSERNIVYSGDLIFTEDATINLTIVDDQEEADNITAGASFPGSMFIEGNKFTNKGFIPLDLEEMGNTIVHEILHQGGVYHPTDNENNANDTKLVKIPSYEFPSGTSKIEKNGSYFTTESTLVPDIYYNIMIYGFKYVNGIKVNDIRGEDKNGKTITPDQMNIINENINEGKINGEALNDY